MVEGRSEHDWSQQGTEGGGEDAAPAGTAEASPDARLADLTAELGPLDRAGAQGAAARGARDVREIGREVAAVLEAAEASAQRIRVKAQREADAIRADAQTAAERVLDDAQREGQALRAELQELRKEVDAYGRKVRADAEAYAADARRSADEEASQKLREAEETLRSARRDAAKIVKDATADGERRKAALEVEAAWFEERFANILTVFRGISSQLESVLRDGRGAAEAEAGAAPQEQESLADDLKGEASVKGEGAGPASQEAPAGADEVAKQRRGRSGRR